MASPSRRLQTKPVITCFKSVLLIYTFIFWVRDGGSRDWRGPPGLDGGCDPERRELRSRQGGGKRGWGLGGRPYWDPGAGEELLGPESSSGISPAPVSGSRRRAAYRLSWDPDVPSVRIPCGGRECPGRELRSAPG